MIAYRGPASSRPAWLALAPALLLTLAMFALLPFSEMVHRAADRQVVLRPLDMTAPPLKPPEVRQPDARRGGAPADAGQQAAARCAGAAYAGEAGPGHAPRTGRADGR